MADASSTLADLELSARVAYGGMASIFVATEQRGGAPARVAVKVLHDHLAEDKHIRRMFLHEAELAGRLSHPNVVRVFRHGEDPTHGAFIVMEYVDGADLALVIKGASKRRRPLDPRVTARLIVDLCRGLHAAHELTGEDGRALNLVHRDVSPHNVLVGADGVARLTDFGIAKSDQRYTMTRPGQLKGKLAYMSPEQLAHEDEPDRRVDVFAAGVVLWESLVSRRLFRADDEVATINKVLLARIEPPSAHWPELAPLDAVTLKALAREREDRFASAQEMADALEAAAAELGGVASREECQAELAGLLEGELERRDDRISRASFTPPAPEAATSSFDLTPVEEGAPSGRWVGAAIAALVLLIGVCGLAIGWLLWGPQGGSAPAPQSPTTQSPRSQSPTTQSPTGALED